MFMEVVSSFMDSVFGSENRIDDSFRAILLRLANYGFVLDSFSDRGGDRQAISLQTSSLDELQRSPGGKNVLFVGRNVAEDA